MPEGYRDHLKCRERFGFEYVVRMAEFFSDRAIGVLIGKNTGPGDRGFAPQESRLILKREIDGEVEIVKPYHIGPFALKIEVPRAGGLGASGFQPTGGG